MYLGTGLGGDSLASMQTVGIEKHDIAYCLLLGRFFHGKVEIYEDFRFIHPLMDFIAALSVGFPGHGLGRAVQRKQVDVRLGYIDCPWVAMQDYIISGMRFFGSNQIFWASDIGHPVTAHGKARLRISLFYRSIYDSFVRMGS